MIRWSTDDWSLGQRSKDCWLWLLAESFDSKVGSGGYKSFYANAFDRGRAGLVVKAA